MNDLRTDFNRSQSRKHPGFASLIQPERLPLRSAFFHLRQVSLVRGNALVGIGFALTVLISHAPELRPTLWLLLPLLLAMWGSAETARCLQKRWNWYHGGVLLLLYADVMVTVLAAFFLIYPWFIPVAGAR